MKLDNYAENNKTKKWVSEGIIIAAISVISYLIVFLYQAGFCNYYGIPLVYININITYVFVVAFALSSILFAYFSILHFSFTISWRGSNPFIKPITKKIPLLSLFSLYCFFLNKNFYIWILGIIFFILVIIIDYISPYIFHKEKNSYHDMFLAQEKTLKENSPPFDLFIEKLTGMGYHTFVIFLGLAFFTFYTLGRTNAIKKDEFFVVNTSPEMVVLTIYIENLICAPFNRKTKKVQRSFAVLRQADNPKQMIRIEKVGPLYPEETVAQ